MVMPLTAAGEPASVSPRRASAGTSAPVAPVAGADTHSSRPGEILPITPGRGTTSPQRSERAGAPETPDPSTGAAPDRAAAPVRVRAGILAGSAPSVSSVLSAGQMAIAKAMSEDRGPDSLDAHVRRLMDDLGLWGYHPLNSIGSRRGWPDWTIIGNRIIYRELKTERGTLRPDQALVRGLILATDGDWALWRPTDLLSGRIAAELAAISGLRVAEVAP